jgi:hypothetical protein
VISKFERKEVHGQSITSSEHSSRKSINELEQEDPINEFRPVNAMRVKRNFNQLKYGNNPMKSDLIKIKNSFHFIQQNINENIQENFLKILVL